jgi:DNA-binding MarR family transcriptional regulator
MNRGHELALALRAAYLAMHRETRAALAPAGATAEQFVVLAALAEAEAATQQELVRRTASDPNTLRAMLVLLEGRGLVERRPHPTDRRARTVALTPDGRRCCERLWGLSAPVRERMAGALEREETEALVRLLRRVEAATGIQEGQTNELDSCAGVGPDRRGRRGLPDREHWRARAAAEGAAAARRSLDGPEPSAGPAGGSRDRADDPR